MIEPTTSRTERKRYPNKFLKKRKYIAADQQAQARRPKKLKNPELIAGHKNPIDGAPHVIAELP